MPHVLNFLRGFLMGSADVVPGVSGGTIALVLGIYQRLIHAIRTGAGALGSLVRTLNQQEAGHGVRACHLCPGDVATDFLDQRPSVPDAEARARMLTAEDIARTACFVLDSPAHVRIDELVVSPVSQA